MTEAVTQILSHICGLSHARGPSPLPPVHHAHLSRRRRSPRTLAELPHRVAAIKAGKAAGTIIVYRSDEAFSVVDLFLVTELEVQAPADSGTAS